MRQKSLAQCFEIWWDAGGVKRVIGVGDDGGRILYEKTGYRVWSVGAKSLLGFGFLQVLAWLGLLWIALRSMRSSGSTAVGFAFLLVLMAGMLLTTAMETLAALWMSLAVLVRWGPAFTARPSLRMAFYRGQFDILPSARQVRCPSR